MIFSDFWYSYFLSYGAFKISWNETLRESPAAGQRALASGSRGACHWSEPRRGVGVSLQERRATMQVMLGVSLRARWDATLVIIMQTDV